MHFNSFIVFAKKTIFRSKKIFKIALFCRKTSFSKLFLIPFWKNSEKFFAGKKFKNQRQLLE